MADGPPQSTAGLVSVGVGAGVPVGMTVEVGVIVEVGVLVGGLTVIKASQPITPRMSSMQQSSTTTRLKR